MKHKLLLGRIFLGLLVMLLFSSFSHAEIGQGKSAIGLNYPGFGIRYFLSDNFAIEGRGQFTKDIVVGGLRSYYYFKLESKVLLFGGLEADFVSFKGDKSKGTGFAGELFVGGEYFFAEKLSLQMDIGPAFISLKDKDTSISESGVEFVVNLGINYYFGG